MSKFTDEVRSLATELDAEVKQAGHAVSTRFLAILAKLKGDDATLTAEAETDAEQVEADAAPVVAEAKQAVENLADEVAADAKDLTTAPAPIEPPAPTA